MQIKKIFLFTIFSSLVFVACKKKDGDPSRLVTVSYPLITVTQGTDTVQYQSPNPIVYYSGIDLSTLGVAPAQIYTFSYPVGSAPAIGVSAYDSGTAAVVPVDTLFNGHLNPNQAGLYIYEFNAKSTNGYGSLVELVIAVTNDTGTISDPYGFVGVRGYNADSATQIIKVNNGLYLNYDGIVGYLTPPSYRAITYGNNTVATFFVQTDSTHILFANQPTNYNYQQGLFVNIGTIGGSSGTVSYTGAGAPVISYTLVSDTLGLNGQTTTFTGF
jgi:hypothetical protein